MVHKVIPEVDAGEVVLTQTVPIYPEDTLEQLEQRMHENEHKIIVDSINKVLGYFFLSHSFCFRNSYKQ
jgi:folate-dependent phosphoribosylglycinamide formyltransferase PurN